MRRRSQAIDAHDELGPLIAFYLLAVLVGKPNPTRIGFRVVDGPLLHIRSGEHI